MDLMERAATACYRWICANLPNAHKVAVVCGTGNNGGDGLAIARMLCHDREVAVFVLDSEKRSPDFAANLERLQKCDKVRICLLSANDALSLPHDTELLIDAVFGTGLTRIAEGRYADALKVMNAHKSSIHLAIDMPSGLFADKATPADSAVFEADITLTFQFAKMAFLFAENHRFVGDFVVLPIGLSPKYIDEEPTQNYLVDETEPPETLKKRPKFSHKGMCPSVAWTACRRLSPRLWSPSMPMKASSPSRQLRWTAIRWWPLVPALAPSRKQGGRYAICYLFAKSPW